MHVNNAAVICWWIIPMKINMHLSLCLNHRLWRSECCFYLLIRLSKPIKPVRQDIAALLISAQMHNQNFNSARHCTGCRTVANCLYLSSPDSLIVFYCRYSLLRHSKERQKVDGLNNLNYSPLVSRRPLYTNITVRLSRELAPIADYWRRHSWTAKHMGIKVL